MIVQKKKKLEDNFREILKHLHCYTYWKACSLESYKLHLIYPHSAAKNRR